MTNWFATKMINWGLFTCEDGKAAGGFDLSDINKVLPDMNITDNVSTNDVLERLENAGELITGGAKTLWNNLADENPERDPKCLYEASYFVVYRIAFANFLFFLTLSIIMIRVRSSADVRANLQNGFWGAKFVVMKAMMIGCLFINDSDTTFNKFMYVIGLMGGLLFILWQLLLLVTFAYEMNRWLLDQRENDDGNTWTAVLAILSFGQMILVLVGVVLLFVYYGPAGCSLHQFFISLVLILTIICGGLAINSDVQEANEDSGLLQAATVSLYLCFMTYSAMSSNLDPDYALCKPNHGESYDLLFGMSGLDLLNGSSVFTMVLAVVLVLYSTINPTALKSDGGSGSTSSDIPMLESGENGENKVQDDETNSVNYSYSKYHITMMMGTLYWFGVFWVGVFL